MSTPYGDDFVLGTLTYGNGTVASDTTAVYQTVDLDVAVQGTRTICATPSDFEAFGTFTIGIYQTANLNVDPYADADWIYFVDHPEFGSFRVFEGATTSVEILAHFGSIDPVGFGNVDDSNAGFLSQDTNVPDSGSLLAVFSLTATGMAVLRRRQKR